MSFGELEAAFDEYIQRYLKSNLRIEGRLTSAHELVLTLELNWTKVDEVVIDLSELSRD